MSLVDGCEWEPSLNRPAWSTDEHHKTTPAEIVVGADGQWRLCEKCAKLPHFDRYKVRRKVAP